MTGTEVAVIGMAGRFPGAKNIAAYWENLRSGKESIVFFTDEQLKVLGVDSTMLNDPDYVRAAALMDDIEHFDASFFDMSPMEATITDPQHRVFLECAWEALENAGHDPAAGGQSIAVFGGSTINTYLLYNLASSKEILDSLNPVQINIGNGADFLTTRVSYKLNLKGPSHVVQSACSTSLVAIHLAAQCLINEECDIALAGGVSINVRQRAGYLYYKDGIVSPDGHCRAFDAAARGTVFGSGVGLVVLRRLKDAISDGDTVHAIIRGSAINNDGAAKVGYTAPSIDGQAEVITEALANAGLSAESITYVEAHGTGTPLGDPVEVRALTKAFATSRRQFCALGSVKTNIGHLDAAAGAAGFIKTVLALKHRELPPSLHFTAPNPEIDFAGTPFYVNSRLTEWGAGSLPRRAGVSSFGVGGTNAHIILEESPQQKSEIATKRSARLLTISAKTETALEKAAANLAACLEKPEYELADIAYTLQVGRRAFNYRRMVVVDSVTEAREALTERLHTAGHAGYAKDGSREIAFMFPGQGAQYLNMGLGLYQEEAVFRESVDRCALLLEKQLGFDLREMIYPGPQQSLQDYSARLEQTSLAQPAIFTVEYAVAQLLISWGLQPKAMIGHSIGEYMAAHLAGVFTLEEALRLLVERGRLMSMAPEGLMLSVPLHESAVRPLLEGTLDLAAINAPNRCVVSGARSDIDRLKRLLEEAGVSVKTLHASHAFHSKLMDSIIEPFVDTVRKIALKKPLIPFVSNLTGGWIKDDEAISPDYWGRHLRQTVRFGDGLARLIDDGYVCIEAGPSNTLSTFARALVDRRRDKTEVVSVMRHPLEQRSDRAVILGGLGRLWIAGVKINWRNLYRQERRLRVPLPTYPFERTRYWIEERRVASGEGVDGTRVNGKGHLDLDFSIGDAEPGRLAVLHPRPALLNDYVPPVTDAERTIARIWQKALGVDRVGANDNFFDLGGDSLIAIEVISQLKARFAVDVPVSSLYENLTVRSLARAYSPECSDEQAGVLAQVDTGDRDDRLSRRRIYQKQRLKRGSA